MEASVWDFVLRHLINLDLSAVLLEGDRGATYKGNGLAVTKEYYPMLMILWSRLDFR